MISKDDVQKIAGLARLTLTDDEVGRLGKELNAIMGFAETIKAIDVTGITPTAHAVEVQNVFRPDEARDANITTSVLERAPKTQDGFFLVPKVL